MSKSACKRPLLLMEKCSGMPLRLWNHYCLTFSSQSLINQCTLVLWNKTDVLLCHEHVLVICTRYMYSLYVLVICTRFPAVLPNRYLGMDGHILGRSHLFTEPGFSEGESILQVSHLTDLTPVLIHVSLLESGFSEGESILQVSHLTDLTPVLIHVSLFVRARLLRGREYSAGKSLNRFNTSLNTCFTVY